MLSLPKIVQLVETDYEGPRGPVDSSESLVRILAPWLELSDREMSLVVSLDGGGLVIAIDTVSIGTHDAVFMAPREVFRTALRRNADSLVLLHNHPQEINPIPSPEDKQLANKLHRGSMVLDLPIRDSIILGRDGKWTSMLAASFFKDGKRVGVAQGTERVATNHEAAGSIPAADTTPT